jgi:hypothetical protein
MFAKIAANAGKILLAILILGAGAYLGIDTSKYVPSDTPTPAHIMEPASSSYPDAGE